MPDDEYIGRQLGNYQIVRLLGKGGFARVYFGEHLYLKTTVAIKVMLTNLAENDLQDFLNEARMVARLRHPHVVRVLEFGIDNKRIPFLVMKLCNSTLRQRHPKGSIIPLKQVVAYVKQVAAALQCAHDQKLVHRDVKPENMLLGHNNDVLLSDFGIAVVARNTLSQSREDVGGTPAYIAPEQLHGRPRAASDQYSLGIVVYEWLCGFPPFNGSNFIQIAAHHLHNSPQPLCERVPSLALEVEAVVMRALAKDPTERFPNIQAFAQALEDASMAKTPLSRSSISSSPIPVGVSPSLPLPIALSAQNATSQINPWDTTRASGFTTIAARSTTARSNRISRRAMVATLGGVVGLSIIAGGTVWLTRPLPSVPPRVKQQQPVLIPSYPIGTTLATYSHHTDKVTGVTWSPDGRWLASSSDDKTVHVWPATEHIQGTPLTYTGHTDAVNAVAWSPNGQYLASASKDKTVRVWDAPGATNNKPGNTLFVYSKMFTDVPALAWSPDSKQLASASSDRTVQAWDAETGKNALYYTDYANGSPGLTSGGPASPVAWSPNSLYIVSCTIMLFVWDVANADIPILHYDGHGSSGGQGNYGVHGLAWSPDSKRIASAGEDQTVQVWNATTGKTLLMYKGHTDAVNAVAWSPNGKYLASASRDKTVQVWDAATGTLALTYSGHMASVNAVAWSRDSRHIASAGDDKQVLLWQGA